MFTIDQDFSQGQHVDQFISIENSNVEFRRVHTTLGLTWLSKLKSDIEYRIVDAENVKMLEARYQDQFGK